MKHLTEAENIRAAATDSYGGTFARELNTARGTIAAVRAEALAEGCQNVQRKPAEWVSREMAIDAGEPTMAGTMLRGEVSEPCGECGNCRILAILDTHDIGEGE